MEISHKHPLLLRIAESGKFKIAPPFPLLIFLFLLLFGTNWFVNHLLTEIWRTTGSSPSASCQPTATLVMSGTTVKLVDNVEVEFDKAGGLGEC